MAESKEELKSLLMKVKEQNEKASLKLNIKKLRSWHSVPLLHADLVLMLAIGNRSRRILGFLTNPALGSEVKIRVGVEEGVVSFL